MRIKNTMKWLGLGLIQLVLVNPIMANEPVPGVNETKKDTGVFTIGAQIRPRFEYRHGFKKPLAEGLKPAAFVEQRTRLWFDYQNSKFRMHLNVQDIRMWGSTDQVYKSDPSMFNVYEAYGEYFINDKWAFKAGRQALNYDNARFFGNLDWAQQGRSHDALLIKYNNKDLQFKADAGISFNQEQNEPTYLNYEPYVQANYKMMYYLWANKSWEKLNVSVLFNNDGREKSFDTTNVYRQTLGLIPTFKSGKWKFGLEAYYQLGETAGPAEENNKVNAYFLAFNATYKTKLTPITIGVDLASGNAYDADANTENGWNPLYGTNHKFYGFMDYFYVGNPHGQNNGSTGLVDIYGKTNFQLGQSKKHFILAHLHYFMSPVELLDLTSINPDATVSSGLGTEIDLVYKFVISKGVVANLGYSQMFITDSMKQIKGQASIIGGYTETGTNNWMWAQFNFSSEFFKFKK